MKRQDLISGMQRLHSGFARSAVDLTTERLEALFDAIGHHDAEVWRIAVSRLLCETRFPEWHRIVDAVEECREAQRRIETKALDSAAKAFFADAPPQIDSDYGRFRHSLLLAVCAGATPADIASRLDAAVDRFPTHGLAAEAERTRAKPSWNPAPEPSWWQAQAKREAPRAGAYREILAQAKLVPDESWDGWAAPAIPHQASKDDPGSTIGG